MAINRPATPLKIAFPGQNVTFLNAARQLIQPWFQFLRNLWLRTGGELGIDAQAVSDEVDALNVLTTYANSPEPTPYPYLPLAITPGASPFSYQAPWSGVVNVFGGTVSQVQFARDGTTFYDYPIAGPVPVFCGDIVKVTYTGAPTMTMVAQ